MSLEAPAIVIVERRIDPAELRRLVGRGADGCLECAARINIRPSQGNRSMEIQGAETRRAVREIVHSPRPTREWRER